MSVSPDFTKVIIWNEQSHVVLVRISDLLNLTQWIFPSISSPINATNKIAISRDSSLAIIETDHYNPIFVVDLNNFEVKYSVSSNQVIHEVNFLDTEKTVLVIFGSNSLVLASFRCLRVLFRGVSFLREGDRVTKNRIFSRPVVWSAM